MLKCGKYTFFGYDWEILFSQHVLGALPVESGGFVIRKAFVVGRNSLPLVLTIFSLKARGYGLGIVKGLPLVVLIKGEIRRDLGREDSVA